MVVIKNNSNIDDDKGSGVARIAQKALMGTSGKNRKKLVTKKI
jgi:hypothetical protein